MLKSSISLLLGAGFSIPAGYPSANEVGKRLTTIKVEDLYIAGNQTLAKNNAKIPQSKYQQEPIKLMLRLIRIYHLLSGCRDFNYENFYDFYTRLCHSPFVNRRIIQIDTYFQQLVALCIDDIGEPKSLAKYKKFVEQIRQLSTSSIVHIHTLNHDGLCEELFGKKISDGFTSLATPYNQNIPIYTGEFDQSIRLYKLHGSFEQYRYCYQTIQNQIDYIKCDKTIDLSSIRNNVDGNVNCNHILIPDYLTGTTTKIHRYKEPHYESLFKLFESDLNESKTWVIVGYSGNDSLINEYLINNSHDKKIIVYDPYPKTALEHLVSKLNAKLIKKSIEDFDINH